MGIISRLRFWSFQPLSALEEFRRSRSFLIPNPWDVGSARFLDKTTIQTVLWMVRTFQAEDPCAPCTHL